MNYYAKKRKELGLDQEELSELLNIRLHTLKRVEAGETTYSPQQAYDFDLLLQNKVREPVPFSLTMLEDCRYSRGMTVQDMENMSGVKADHICKIETGDVRPTATTIEKFRKGLEKWDSRSEQDQFR